MDLGTIAGRLESGFYASAAAVHEDVRLVWRNCRTFNEPGSDVSKSCDELAGFFDQLWKQAKLEKAAVRSLCTPSVMNLPEGLESQRLLWRHLVGISISIMQE
jgi:hypothetical protein